MNMENNPQPPWDVEQARRLERLGVYAFVRTAFSSERSLQSWMRTSISLYTFGFSLSKFLDYLEQRESTQFSAGPRLLGLALICIGILVLVLAAIEHVRRIRKMTERGLPAVSHFSLPIAVSVALVAVGIVSLLWIVMN